MIKYYESMILIKLIDQNHDIRSNKNTEARHRDS